MIKKLSVLFTLFSLHVPSSSVDRPKYIIPITNHTEIAGSIEVFLININSTKNMFLYVKKK